MRKTYYTYKYYFIFFGQKKKKEKTRNWVVMIFFYKDFKFNVLQYGADCFLTVMDGAGIVGDNRSWHLVCENEGGGVLVYNSCLICFVDQWESRGLYCDYGGRACHKLYRRHTWFWSHCRGIWRDAWRHQVGTCNLQVSLLLIACSFVVLILDSGKCVFWLKHPIQMTIRNFNLTVVFQMIIMCYLWAVIMYFFMLAIWYGS